MLVVKSRHRAHHSIELGNDQPLITQIKQCSVSVTSNKNMCISLPCYFFSAFTEMFHKDYSSIIRIHLQEHYIQINPGRQMPYIVLLISIRQKF